MKMKAENFTQYLKGKEMSLKSVETYTIVVERFLSWLKTENMKAEQARHQDILAFMKHCQKKGVSQRTIKHYLGCVKAYYDHLTESNAVKANPAQSIKVQGVKRKILYQILESHELHAIYNSYKSETLSGKKYKVILGLLVYQGLKTEELEKLEVQDVKLKEGKIEVPGAKKSNGRTLQLESHQVLDVYEYVMQVRPKIIEKIRQPAYAQASADRQTTKLFISQEPLIRINFLMAQLRKQHPKLKNADQIRASVIVKWLRQYNLREVQYLAGHRYISSTEAYQQNEMEGLSEEVNRFHPLG
jgi:site-specific recombinase XerD